MASREIRDLTPEAQVLWNKFHDRCRRDTRLLRHGVVVLLTCTSRDRSERDASGGAPLVQNGSFEFYVLRYGRIMLVSDDSIEIVRQHLRDIGIWSTGFTPFECEEIV